MAIYSIQSENEFGMLNITDKAMLESLGYRLEKTNQHYYIFLDGPGSIDRLARELDYGLMYESGLETITILKKH